MKASLAWLKSLLPGLEAEPQEVAERLTQSGLEIEELIEYGAASPTVVVAAVQKVEKHPKRDKLSLVSVDRGGVEQVVVCGAPNVPAPGGRVILAPLDTVLPAVGLTVGSRAIGGIVSEGMLCSEQELGLLGGGGKGDGIIALPEQFDAALGTSLSEAMPSSHDVVFDIGITPNRPDALGHYGLARDLAALFDLKFEAPPPAAPARVAPELNISQLASVQIEDTERCPHYGAAAVVDITVGPSPDWLRHRLESLGIRAINNVVDVSNLILLEFGQPMHAFDLDKLPEGRIVVRRARDGESITTLDEGERKLVADDLVITDGEKPVALAGVMGGANTEITSSTKRVLLECAHFTPRGVRRTARRHGLHSDSSYRFERGCDPEIVPDALAHAASLLTQLCDGKAVPGTILAGVEPAARRRVRLRGARLNSLLGVAIALDEASAILERLGCSVMRSEKHADQLDVEVPSYRPDISIEVDLIEEVMRIYGIDRIPTAGKSLLPLGGRSQLTVEDRVRSAAVESGLSEALTFSFVAPEDLEKLGAPAPVVKLKHPLSEERSVMRTSLLPGLLEALRRATHRGVSDVRLFTAARCYCEPADDDASLPREQRRFAAVVAGNRTRALAKPEAVDVFDAKGIALAIIERASGRQARVERGTAAHLHPRGAAELYVAEVNVGRFGPLHPEMADRFDLDGPCLVIELDIDALSELGYELPQYQPIPVLPAVSRDIALVVSQDVNAGELAQVIRDAAGELCESVELFDRFCGKGVPELHQSLAFHLLFRDPKAAYEPENARTLTDEEVDKVAAELLATVKAKFSASVRGA